MLAIVALIVVAAAFALFTTHLRPYNASPTPEEQAEIDQQQQIQQQKINQATQAKIQHSPASAADLNTFAANSKGAVHATLVVEGKGAIGLELYPRAAPKTVSHFVSLAKRHFYDGILFHRVVPGFVAQAGDPTSKKVDQAQLKSMTPEQAASQLNLGNGGSGQTVPLETTLPNIPNSVGLARGKSEDSGDSQFYINLGNNVPLNGKYCVFGRVVSGQDVVGRIAMGDRITSLTVP
ncbi:MAG TPA: peptidylprolyl isomerase [Chthonomonadales bacterium]|nr:peptidylprolyl isomerase [Chthonomonadales bacterium]